MEHFILVMKDVIDVQQNQVIQMNINVLFVYLNIIEFIIILYNV